MATYVINFLLLPSLFFPSAISQLLNSSYRGTEGEWKLLKPSIGISAMHMQLLHNNKVVIFDRTDFGRSNISLPGGLCRYDPEELFVKIDCTAHSVLYDIGTNTFRPLTVQTDTWCSSGAVLPNGTLLQTGGFNDGDHSVRLFSPCTDQLCDWIEFPRYLMEHRWYSTDQILPDGRVIVIGGRRHFTYEFYPHDDNIPFSLSSHWLNFLRETSNENEDNLYPFVHLLPNGNLYIFANTRSISLDYKRNIVIREFPPINGSVPRNYPSSGSSVLLPINENKPIEAEVMVCGGAPRPAFSSAKQGAFMRASSTCGRLKVSDKNPSWSIESMPMPRVMGDMVLLPNGDIVIINGAGSGTAGWELARNPVMRPVIYHPNRPKKERFSVMRSAERPRLYHSTAILIPDGRILVGGSNPHIGYNFTGVLFPTDLSLEAFSPPYLAAGCEQLKPTIRCADEILGYKKPFKVTFAVSKFLPDGIISVRIVAPSFTTHALGMNQRMVVLKGVEASPVGPGSYRLTSIGPSAPAIAPPGYYMLFVVHAGIPSSAVWVKVQ